MHGKQQQNLWPAQEGQAVTSRHRTATFKATLLPTTASLFIKTLRDAALKGPLKRQSNCCTVEALPPSSGSQGPPFPSVLLQLASSEGAPEPEACHYSFPYRPALPGLESRSGMKSMHVGLQVREETPVRVPSEACPPGLSDRTGGC